MPGPRRTIIVRLDQMNAIASPVRQEVLDALTRMGTASLAELAQALGRPADGLYYHVRTLQKVGLVRAAGSRMRGGRREALVRATASEYVLRYATAPPAHSRAINAIVAGMLRLGVRDFRRAFGAEPGVNKLEGPARDLWALRASGWLTPKDVAEVNRGMKGLSRTLSRPGRRGRLYAITILLTPVDHRGRPTPAPRKKPRP